MYVVFPEMTIEAFYNRFAHDVWSCDPYNGIGKHYEQTLTTNHGLASWIKYQIFLQTFGITL